MVEVLIDASYISDCFLSMDRTTEGSERYSDLPLLYLVPLASVVELIV